MAKVTWRGGALIAPVPPAMISCGTMEKSNIITVAWTGILGTVPPKTYISVRPRRHSYNIIKESGEFVINLTTEALIHAADYCGMYTGAKVDKFSACHLQKEEVPGFSCPMIAEAPLSLACRVTDVIPMGSHDMFIADVVSVHVDETLIDENGKLRLENAHLAAFAHGEYFGLGKKLGWFGFSAVKKKKKKTNDHPVAPKSKPHTTTKKPEKKKQKH
jgi:flavin reductase (DIM6/NTAB) family NADH-FMN oxidoreductase RutF